MYYPQEYDKKRLLIELAEKYEDMEYFKEDPIIFPKQYSVIQDIEISGLLSSVLSFGNRKQIVKKSRELDDLMDNKPYKFIKDGKYYQWKDNNKSFYRFIKYSDLYDICRMIDSIYQQFYTLEETVINQKRQYPNFPIVHLLCNFMNCAGKINGIPYPNESNACKRMNMFLRWMIRKNSPVDIGCWQQILSKELYIPLDVHVGNTARELGLTNRKSNDWRTVAEITDKLKEVFPNDPCKGDLALFGYDFYKE